MAETFVTRVGSEGAGIFVEVPEEVMARLGPRKRPPVVVTVNGHSWRSTPAIYGGKAYLGFRRDIRERAGISAGDELTVQLEPDTRPRMVEVPPDLERVLAAEPEAKAAFDRLSFTSRKEYVGWITEARREETRGARLVKAVEMLRAGIKEPR